MVHLRWSAESVFPRIILFVEHAIIRGAVIGRVSKRNGDTFETFPARIQLHGKTFELLWDATLGAEYLPLPLQPSDLHMPTMGATTFLPHNHWMMSQAMDTAIGRSIIAMADLGPEDMHNFLNRHQDDYFDIEPWLLADLAGLHHHTHIPALVPHHWLHYDDDPDDDAPPHLRPITRDPPGMSVSTLWSEASLPRIRASLPGTGAPPNPRVVFFGDVPPPHPPPQMHA